MAQLVEQLIRNQQVVGSSPTTSSRQSPRNRRFRGLFVLASIVSSTIFYKNFTQASFCGTIEKTPTERRRMTAMRILFLIFAWIFSLFCLCLVPVYGIFSVTGFLGLLVGLLALPIAPIRRLWDRILPPQSPRFSRQALLFAAFCVLLAAAPTPYTNAATGLTDSAAVTAQKKAALVPVPTAAADVSTPQPGWTPAPTASIKDEASESASLALTPESSSAASQTAQGQDDQELVYIAGSGKGTRYHSDPTCSQMKNATPLTKEEAEARGYSPCKRCIG